jgi:predicted DNA-binding transcriptional regulator YafY
MSRYGNLKKFLLIIRLLQESKQQVPPLKTIQTHLESHGFRNISSRTLSRDFQALHDEFGIRIQYDDRKRGYLICTPTDEDVSDFSQFLKLLELAERVETIAQSLQSASKASRSIVFENNDFFKGSEYLKPLADAIHRKIKVSFDYHPYQKPLPDHYTVAPYLVMEHRNR